MSDDDGSALWQTIGILGVALVAGLVSIFVVWWLIRNCSRLLGRTPTTAANKPADPPGRQQPGRGQAGGVVCYDTPEAALYFGLRQLAAASRTAQHPPAAGDEFLRPSAPPPSYHELFPSQISRERY